MQEAPAYDVFQRGADLAATMLWHGRRLAQLPPDLARQWVDSVTLDPAPLVALEIAAHASLGLARATLAMPGGEATVRAELAWLQRAGTEDEKQLLTTLVVKR
jgi:hypothetical protein